MRERDDTPPDTIFWLGKSQLKNREWDKAVEAMEKAVQMEPSNAMYHLWLGRAYGARAENRFVLRAYSDAKRVLKEFQKARELDAGDIGIRFDLLEFYVQANGLVGGDEEKAWAEAEAIAMLDPAIGFTARATIYERKEKWNLAEKEYRNGIEEYPRNSNLQKDLAQFLFNRGNYKEALETVEKSLELNSQSKQARFLEAASRVNLIRLDVEKAEKNMRELAGSPLGDDDPAREDVYYWQGVLYDLTGNRTKARDTLEKALQVNPAHETAKEYLKKNF